MPKKISNYTLFLDRDGVINQRIPNSYIKNWSEFEFLEGSLEAIVGLKKVFKRIVVVTNQQGIGKGIMTTEDLKRVHARMLLEIGQAGGYIDNVYHCPELARNNPFCRKPNPGMAKQAQTDFPDIDFSKSIVVGDSLSDMDFGIRLGMTTVFITTKREEQDRSWELPIDFRYSSLWDFYKSLNI